MTKFSSDLNQKFEKISPNKVSSNELSGPLFGYANFGPLAQLAVFLILLCINL